MTGVNTTRATVVQSDRTPLLSPATVQKLDAGGYDDDDDPLSDPPQTTRLVMTTRRSPSLRSSPRTTVGDVETGPKEAGMGKKDTGGNLGDPTDTQDSVLPSTSGQQLGPH